MKKFSKILSVALLVALVLSLGISSAFADGETGTITIQNAAMGETYKAFKLFNATVNADGSSIAYTGDIPADLAAFFTKDTAGNISKAEGKTDAEITAAVQDWAKAQPDSAVAAQGVADGGPLTLSVPYGYYAVTSSQGAVVSVDSTNPEAEIYDKNEKEIELSKTVDDKNVKIGQTVTYTVTWNAPNYDGSGADAEQIVEYRLKDTLPTAFLKDVKVTSLKIGDTEMVTLNEGTITAVAGEITGVQSFAPNTEIVIPWVDSEGNNLYKNNSVITLTYTAVVTDTVDTTETGNTNEVTLTWKTTSGDKGPKKDTETIYSYNFGLKKVDENGNALAGATFELPFYVKASDVANVYLYAGTEAGDGLTKTVTTPAGGEVYIKGIATDETTNTEDVKNTTFSITETVAPAGYNKLTAAFDVVCTPVWNQTVTRYYDADGKLVNTVTEANETKEDNVTVAVAGFQDVINNRGGVLPSTGGIGTTIFYVVGGVLVLAAIILLVTKKRMSE